MPENFEITALSAINHLERSERSLNNSVAKLSSGSAIPSAKDNVSSMSISSRLLTSVETHNAINSNISTGVSIGQFAEATYAQTVGMVTRLKVLALQATSDNYSNVERALIDTEYQNLLEEIDRLAKDAVFNGIKVAETGITPIVAATSFDDSTLPTGSFVPTGGSNTAVIGGGTMQLIDEPDPANIQGVYLNDQEFLLEAGLTAEFNIEVGLPAGASPTNIGGGFSFFMFDADVVDFSGGNGTADLGSTAANNLLYYTNGTDPAAGGFLAVGFESNGSFGNAPNQDDAVTVVGPTSLPAGQLGTVNLDGANGFGTGLDGAGAASGASQVNQFNIQLTITEDLQLSVILTNTATGNSQEVVDPAAQDLSGLVVPRALKFGFGATIAGLNNRFAVNDFEVLANADVNGRMTEAALEFKAAANTNASTQQLFMPLFDATVEGLTLENTNVRTKANAEFAIDRLDFALEQAVEAQSVAGAAVARFEKAQDVLTVKIENLERARSGLADLNVAKEVTRLTALQIQQASGINMLGNTRDIIRSVGQIVTSHDSNATAAARILNG